MVDRRRGRGESCGERRAPTVAPGDVSRCRGAAPTPAAHGIVRTGHRRPAGQLATSFGLTFVSVPEQPLLADGSKFKLVVSLQTSRRQHDDRHEQKNGRREGDGEGADHGAINIRSSGHRAQVRCITPLNRRADASSRARLHAPCRRTTTSSHHGAGSRRLRQAREDRRVERSS